jgi:hypothetical protein
VSLKALNASQEQSCERQVEMGSLYMNASASLEEEEQQQQLGSFLLFSLSGIFILCTIFGEGVLSLGHLWVMVWLPRIILSVKG